MTAPTSSNKLLFICGPTATGKTVLAARLAKKFSGSLISADSRQVYRGMDTGTGKDRPPGVTIYGYDLVNPNQNFSVADWVSFIWPVIKQLWAKNKLPIIVGGTGLYLKSLIEPPASLGIRPDKKLRSQLNNLPVSDLQHKLRQLDLTRFNQMNYSDQHNPRRLIRAIEITGSKPSLAEVPQTSTLWLCLTAPLPIIDQRIRERVVSRAKHGMTAEINQLMAQYPAWTLPAFSATGYRQWRDYLEGKTTRQSAIGRWQTVERQYARNQITWFKKQAEIHWFDISRLNWQNQAKELVKKWWYGKSD